MTEHIGRALAFLFLASVVGLLEIAIARAFARTVREALEDFRAWRQRRAERRADRRALVDYESDFAHLDEIQEER